MLSHRHGHDPPDWQNIPAIKPIDLTMSPQAG